MLKDLTSGTLIRDMPLNRCGTLPADLEFVWSETNVCAVALKATGKVLNNKISVGHCRFATKTRTVAWTFFGKCQFKASENSFYQPVLPHYFCPGFENVETKFFKDQLGDCYEYLLRDGIDIAPTKSAVADEFCGAETTQMFVSPLAFGEPSYQNPESSSSSSSGESESGESNSGEPTFGPPTGTTSNPPTMTPDGKYINTGGSTYYNPSNGSSITIPEGGTGIVISTTGETVTCLAYNCNP